MPAKKPAKTPPPPAAADNEPLYPAIEGFIERATAEEIAELFNPLKEGLSALKRPCHVQPQQKDRYNAPHNQPFCLKYRNGRMADRIIRPMAKG